jgi:putative iron-dependent peroxidase
MSSQAGILSAVSPAARYIVLDVPPDVSAHDLVKRLRELAVGEHLVVGLGEPFLRALGVEHPGLRTFPSMSGAGCAVPSTQGALFLHTRGEDHGDTLAAMHQALVAIDPKRVLRIAEDVVAFRHLEGRDLSGYEDGTENPKGDEATAAALCDDGSSFVAAQRWIHDLGGFLGMSQTQRDHIIGRSRETNDELDDAPPSAHVKRAAQEDFDPPAFMIRRSMPYGTVTEHGLYFVAYARSLDPYDQVLRRMIGRDDGIVDGLFRFSRPVSGGFYWCPALRGTQLDLHALDR